MKLGDLEYENKCIIIFMYKQKNGGYMLNSVILIGRLVDTPTLTVYDKELAVTTITLAVNRSFKNHEGEIETDFIRCVFWDIYARNITEYCRRGDCVAVRGRIQSKISEVSFEKDGETLKKRIQILEVIGERIVFLSSPNSKKDETLES